MITVIINVEGEEAGRRFDIPVSRPEQARQVLMNYWASTRAQNLAVMRGEYFAHDDEVLWDSPLEFSEYERVDDQRFIDVPATTQRGCVHSKDPGCTVRDYYCTRCGSGVGRTQCGNDGGFRAATDSHVCREDFEEEA